MSRNKKKQSEESPIKVDFSKTLRDAAELLARETKSKELTAEELAFFDATYTAENGQVLVQKLEAGEEVTQGGIIKERNLRTDEAQVILCGPGEWQNGVFIPIAYEPGIRVLVTRYGGTNVILEDRELTLVHYKQIYLRKKAKA